MPMPLKWIDCHAGRLGIMARPRGGEWLDDEVRALSEAGVSRLVSLLTDAEIKELDLADLEGACKRQGIQFSRFAILDRGVPSDSTQADELVRMIVADVSAGGLVMIHCRAGIGRSAMIGAAVLAHWGTDPDIAFAKIAEARGWSVPDTPEQLEWVRSQKRKAR